MSGGRKKVRGAAGYCIQRRPAAPDFDVVVSTPAAQVLRELFGRDLARAEIAALGLAMPGCRIKVDIDEDNDPVIHTIGANLQATNALQKSARGLELVIGNIVISGHLRRRGLGTHVFCSAIQAASQLKLRRIVAFATRGQNANGFYTFPRIGFDGIIPGHVRTQLPALYRDFESVLELLNAEGGLATWLKYGVSIPVAFELADGSRSRQVLEKYTAQMRRR